MNLPHLSKLSSLTRTISIESSSISIPFIPVFKHRSNKLVHRPEHATSPSSWSTLPSQLNHTNRYPFSALSLSLLFQDHGYLRFHARSKYSRSIESSRHPRNRKPFVRSKFIVEREEARERGMERERERWGHVSDSALVLCVAQWGIIGAEIQRALFLLAQFTRRRRLCHSSRSLVPARHRHYHCYQPPTLSATLSS